MGAEIKHGRVAMAGFLGFCAQCTDIVKGPHEYLPYRGYVENVSPQEQWDNIPLIGKLQILTFVGMLESYGEGAAATSPSTSTTPKAVFRASILPSRARASTASSSSTSTTPLASPLRPPRRRRSAAAVSRSTTAALPCLASSRSSPSPRASLSLPLTSSRASPSTTATS